MPREWTFYKLYVSYDQVNTDHFQLVFEMQFCNTFSGSYTVKLHLTALL